MTALGLDCGGSASRWCLLDNDGRRIAGGEAPGISGHLFTEEQRAALDAVLVRLCGALRESGRPIATLVAGVTGLSEGSTEATVFAARLSSGLGLPVDRVRITGDAEIAFRTTFTPGTGILVYSGTGSFAYHLDAAGTAHRVGGHGFVLGDGGSAFWIGQAALAWLLRRWDRGDFEATPLSERLCAEMGGTDWEAVRRFVYQEPRTQLASLASGVATSADADPAAMDILRAAGRELAALAEALSGRVGAQPLALIGGAAALGPAIREAFIAAAGPLAPVDGALTEPSCTPAEAAARLALDLA